MPNLPTEIPVVTGPEQTGQSKVSEQQLGKSISQGAKNLLHRFSGWIKSENPDPDAALKEIDTFSDNTKKDSKIEEDNKEPTTRIESSSSTDEVKSLSDLEDDKISPVVREPLPTVDTYETEVGTLEEPMIKICESLKPWLESPYYSVIIGDDTSGRIPALILKGVSDYISGSSGIDGLKLVSLSGMVETPRL